MTGGNQHCRFSRRLAVVPGVGWLVGCLFCRKKSWTMFGRLVGTTTTTTLVRASETSRFHLNCSFEILHSNPCGRPARPAGPTFVNGGLVGRYPTLTWYLSSWRIGNGFLPAHVLAPIQYRSYGAGSKEDKVQVCHPDCSHRHGPVPYPSSSHPSLFSLTSVCIPYQRFGSRPLVVVCSFVRSFLPSFVPSFVPFSDTKRYHYHHHHYHQHVQAVT